MMKSIKESQTIHKLISTCLLVALVSATCYAQSPRSQLQSIKFSVLSVRIMGDDEAVARAPHVLGIDVAVRLRISNEGKKAVYFLAFDGFDSYVPIGFDIKKTDKGIVWRYGREGRRENSPGVTEASAGLPTKWVILKPYTAIEWEMLDSTLFKNERHAFTMFVKEKESDEPLELMSDFFTVPIK